MIHHTRITVDDETRRVLDELSGHLAQTPSWAGGLTNEIRAEIRNATRDTLAAPIKSIGQLDAQFAALQVRMAAATDTLAGLTAATQALDGRVAAQVEVLDRQVRAVDAAGEVAAGQTRAIVALQQHAQATNDKVDALRAIADAHERQLAVLIDHAQKLGAATDALLGTHAMLHDLQTVQAAQRDVLQTVLRRVDHLSKPWWKRLFGAAGDAR
ncbi:hypothetical protein [Burkholderia sp. Bp8990]|uniref:hypothetical protein n=1 Tax=Burkholderia sp. Bp8990 TaxID=2184552 RepID=UPI000F590E6B|nr:hypothetical protein [Burkholderia sp. Bp8990]RQS40473.1 hypothetical protein DIE01_14180 [Burkholderia sp. Bp8990]